MQNEVTSQQKRSIEFLSQRHQLMAYLIGLVGDANLAEDLFQEVWLKLSAYEGDDIQNTAAWCRGVAKNLVLHHWRDKGRAKVSANSEILEKLDQAFDEKDDDIQGQKQEALQNCVKSLPENSKTLLQKKYVEGSSFAEMSKQLGKTESSLMMSLSRIRKKLQECIELKLKQTGALS